VIDGDGFDDFCVKQPVEPNQITVSPKILILNHIHVALQLYMGPLLNTTLIILHELRGLVSYY
jgi:hypothetical protein